LNLPIPIKEPVNSFGVLTNIYWDELNNKQIESLKKGFSLSDNIELKILDSEETEKLSHLLPVESEYFSSHPSLYIALKLKNVKIDMYFITEYHDIKKALLCFRLLKSGEIFIENIYNVFHSENLNPIKFSNLPPYHWEGLYNFKYDEIKDIKNIYKLIDKIDFNKHSPMKIACDRFDRSYYDFNNEDKLIDLRVEDHEHPVQELRRVLKLYRAYKHMDEGDLAMEHSDMETALKEYDTALEMFPQNLEMKFWTAVTLANNQKISEALKLFKEAFEKDENWRLLAERLPKSDLLNVTDEELNKILDL